MVFYDTFYLCAKLKKKIWGMFIILKGVRFCLNTLMKILHKFNGSNAVYFSPSS